MRSRPWTLLCGRGPTIVRTPDGFTLIELLVYLGLVAVMAGSALPLWIALQHRSTSSSDQVIRLLMSRVVIARIERDLRLASAEDSSGASCVALLECSPTQLVTVTRTQDSGSLELVEWELVGDALMRRRGVWTGSAVGPFAHNRYFDHKTMLEDVLSPSAFRYISDGIALPAPVEPESLGLVTNVALDLYVGDGIREHRMQRAFCSVGR